MEQIETVYLFILVKLVLAHFVGDFLLQPDSWVLHKREYGLRSHFLYLHSFIHGMLVFILIPDVRGLFMGGVIMTVHAVTDLLTSARKKSFALFVTDQAVHMLAILILWLTVYGLYTQFFSFIGWVMSYGDILLITIAYIVVIWPASHLITAATAGWSGELEYEESGGLKDAGKWIGRLERFLALTFILIGHFPSVGFLIAAKSIFRFGDLRESSDRKRTEYILIGTLLSFSIAFAVGLLAKILI